MLTMNENIPYSLRNKPETPVKNDITCFSDKEKALFALAIAKRQWPNFKLWSELDDSRGNLGPIFKRCLDYMSSFLQGDGSQKGVSARLEDISFLVNETLKDKSFGGLFAYDAVSTVELAYEAASGANEDAAEDASMMSITGVYKRLETDGMQEDPEDSSLLMEEYEVQRSIASIIASKGKHDDGRLQLSLIREVLEASLKEGVSNIGIPLE